jgi:hypothetical protein
LRFGAAGNARVAALLAAISLLLVSAGCESSVATSPSPRPSETRSPSPPIHLDPHTLAALGPRGVGSLDCGSQQIGWPTDSQPIVNEIVPRRDIIQAIAQDGGQPKTVARARHGGDLDSPVPISEPWLVYIEYQQHLESSSADFWYLDAVNLNTQQSVVLASASAGAPLNELPRYAISGARVVWDQLDATGAPRLFLHDFASGSTAAINLPAGTFPVNPAISGDDVFFVDNSADPNSANEDWLGRRGSLRMYNLATSGLSTIDPDPTAYVVGAAGGVAVWLDLTAGGTTVIKAIDLARGGERVIGNYAGIPETNGAAVVWYDSRSNQYMLFVLHTGSFLRLQLGDWRVAQGPYALCGNRLFFAVAPGYDGGTSTVRYVGLGDLMAA